MTRLESQYLAESVTGRHHANPGNDGVEDDQAGTAGCELHRTGEKADIEDFPETGEPVIVQPVQQFANVGIHQVVGCDDGHADYAHGGRRQFHQAGHQDHGTSNHPNNPCHLVMPEIEIEGPRQAQKGEFEENQPDPAQQEILRQIGVLAAVEETAGSRQKNEGRRAEMGDPAGEENCRRRATRRNAGIHSHVVDRHEDHYRAADEVDGLDARSRVTSVAGRSDRGTGSHEFLLPLKLAANANGPI